jgi:membrane-bound lytic murein transglycosylase F
VAMKALAHALVFACLALLCACEKPARPIPSLKDGGNLVVVTFNGPVTYFEDAQGNPTGFEYDLARMFGEEVGRKVDFLLVENASKVFQVLQEKQAHFAAAAQVQESITGIVFGPPYFDVTHQVIFRAGEAKPKTRSDLVGKRVAAIASSRADDYFAGKPPTGTQLVNLPEGTPPDELLAWVVRGDADYAIVDSLLFSTGRKFHPELEFAFTIGKPQQYAWPFAASYADELIPKAKVFFERIKRDGTLKHLVEKYFAHVSRMSAIDAGTLLERVVTLLPGLRGHFHQAQDASGIDWRMIAAIGYQESHWDPLATSPTGVRGLMMLTEDTATRMKVKDRLDARDSILGGALYFAQLRALVPARIKEPDRTWFALAAYNMGYGHLEDVRILAQRMKLDPDDWLSVRKALPMLSDPEIYPTLKHGYSRGYETMQFVDNVRNYYDIISKLEARRDPGLAGSAILVQGSSKASAPPR